MCRRIRHISQKENRSTTATEPVQIHNEKYNIRNILAMSKHTILIMKIILKNKAEEKRGRGQQVTVYRTVTEAERNQHDRVHHDCIQLRKLEIQYN